MNRDGGGSGGGKGQPNEPVPSPCISLCVMDGQRRYCQGCRRTLGEIAAWRGLSDDEKRAVLAQLPTRDGVGSGGS